MGFGTIRQVALWAVVLSALGIGVYVLAQGVSAPPPVNLGPGITIQQSDIPSRSRPIAPANSEASGTPATPSSASPAPTTVIPSKSAPVKPLPPSKADDDDDDDNDDDVDLDD
ncbi:hypothetical protein [Paeniglutamicibacter kerguelensis]|uniref:Small secreted hydrophilic protein n=1 Tax=Paeniglutamicibacter kerguelensis TaxID=254788 RepID=A0ABS4XF32_9MICC|nr:hypothetical protein [Paeniglutamicibacter kerguelensis]MBP2387064.1 hypothetical protein [Paeniglutamicibacter kerguelensis]